jgi:hypothetical protein
MPASRPTSTSWRCGCSTTLFGQHQRRDRRARMDRAQPRSLQDQGRQHLARPRGARIDSSPTPWCRPSSASPARVLRSSPRPATGAASPRPELRATAASGVPCNAPSAICVGSLDTRGTSDLSDDRVSDSSSRGPTRFDLLAKPDLIRARRQHRVAGGARKLPVQRLSVPSASAGSDRQARLLHALGHEHGVTRGWAGAAALLLRENHGAIGSCLEDPRCSSPRGCCR